MNMEWWEIPMIAIGMAIGSYLGNICSIWIKRKLGWIPK